MKRTPLKRGAPLKRGGPIRKTRRARERAKARHERDFGEKAAFIRQQPCCACHKPGPSHPHHVKSRGAGGTSKDLVPLCAGPSGCHEAVHRVGARTFGARWNINLTQKAVVYEGWWQDGQRTGEVDLGF